MHTLIHAMRTSSVHMHKVITHARTTGLNVQVSHTHWITCQHNMHSYATINDEPGSGQPDSRKPRNDGRRAICIQVVHIHAIHVLQYKHHIVCCAYTYVARIAQYITHSTHAGMYSVTKQLLRIKCQQQEGCVLNTRRGHSR